MKDGNPPAPGMMFENEDDLPYVGVGHPDELDEGGETPLRVRFTSRADLSKHCLRSIRTHHSLVHAVRYFADGQRLLSASRDGTIQVWEVSSGRCLRTISCSTGAFQDVAILPNERFVVSAGEDRTLRLWELDSGNQEKVLVGHKGMVTSLLLDQCGHRIASLSFDGTLRVWDLSSGRSLTCVEMGTCTLLGPSPTLAAVTPGLERVLVAVGSGPLKLVDTIAGRIIGEIGQREDQAKSVVFWPARKQAIVGYSDQNIRVWDLVSGNCLRTLQGHSSQVDYLALAPRNARLLSGSIDNNIRVWDLESGTCDQIIYSQGEYTRDLSIHPNGDRVAEANSAGALRVWNLEGDTPCPPPRGHKYSVAKLITLKDGDRIISRGLDEKVRVWDLPSGSCLREISPGHRAIFDMCLHPDQRMLFLHGIENVSIWEIEAGRQVVRMPKPVAHSMYMAMHPDGRHVLYIGGDHLTTELGHQSFAPVLWDLEQPELSRTLKPPSKRLNKIHITHDGDRALGIGSDGWVYTWELRTGDIVDQYGLGGPKTQIVDTSDKLVIAAGSTGVVAFFDLKTGARLALFAAHEPSQGIADVAFFPDGARAVSAGYDGVLKVWDIERRCCLARWTADTNLTTCEVTSRGQILVGDEGGNVTCLELPWTQKS